MRHRIRRSFFHSLTLAVVGACILAPAVSFSQAAYATGNTVFVNAPGVGPPPSTLGPYSMTPFALDTTHHDVCTTTGGSPTGALGFSRAVGHTTNGDRWSGWSAGHGNNYTGDVYVEDPYTPCPATAPVTITLPANTHAFYLYGQPADTAVYNLTVASNDGTTSGPVPVNGDNGAAYFGFYDIFAPITSVTISTSDPGGFAVGEFGINGPCSAGRYRTCGP